MAGRGEIDKATHGTEKIEIVGLIERSKRRSVLINESKTFNWMERAAKAAESLQQQRPSPSNQSGTMRQRH